MVMMSLRGCLSLLLSIWLVLVMLRQGMDLIGRLWLPVLFNLIQMLVIISGLFAVCQRRRCLLVALCCSTLISIIYNILLFLWWIGVFGQRDRPLLSAGLPYSYSFWTRYTPFCASHFNLTSSRWVQSPCPLPFYQIEAGEAVLHSLIGFVILLLAGILIIRRRQKRIPDLSPKQPTITVQFSPDHHHHHHQHGMSTVPVMDRSSEHSSGYMNSSYDEAEARPTRQRQHLRCQDLDNRARSLSPHRRSRRIVVEDEEDEEEPEAAYSQPRLRHASARNLKMTGGVKRIISHDQIVQQQPQSSNDSFTNLTSLISFDPKSNTLIRVREHNIQDDEDVDEDDEDSSPRVHDPIPDRGSCDSGVPGSSAGDWPPPPRIGYDPALHDVAPPPIPYDNRRRAPVGYDPALHDATPPPIPYDNRRRAPIGHYHSPNSIRLMAYETEPRKPPATVPVINQQSLLV